jgi:uncharacterized protein
MSDSQGADEPRKFRILSLDGGGIKGAFTASTLALLERETNCRAVEHFDLITGTSTGGILAIGLSLGFSASELLQFYVERGPEIFPSTGLRSRLGWLRQIFGPKHSHEVLRRALADRLGERLFGEAQCRLAIPTYDAVTGRVYIMKTAHQPRALFDVDALAVDVALATSAAPTYFQAAVFPAHLGASYVDGGVWANCPAMVGVTEAIAFLGQQARDIDVLSIGTTFQPFNIASQRGAGAAGWNVGIIQLMFEAQVEAARAQAKLIAGGFHRIDATVMQGEFALDRADADTIERLAIRGHAEASRRENLDVVRTRFLDGRKAAPYTKYR